MSKWESKEIKCFGRVVTGKTPPKDEEKYFNGEYLFVSPKDLDWDKRYVFDTETKITKEALEKFKNQKLPKNAIMYTSLSFAFGKIGIASETLLTNQQINSIIVNPDNYFRFIYYLLRANRPLIFSYNSGIDTPIVPKSVFEKIELKCPLLPVQKKIAAVLSAYDDLIENNDRRIALLEKMAEEIYREWFVRLRFPGHEQVTFHKGIPEDWAVVRLGNICHLITDGKHGDCKDELNSEYYFISAKDVNNGKINYENAREIAKADFEETHKRTNLKPNDILITNSGTIGRIAIVSNSKKTFRTTFQKSVAIVKPNAELVSTYFLYQTFIDKNNILSDFASGTAQKNLLLGDLRRFKILLPPFKLQQNFNEIIVPIFDRIESLRDVNHILCPTRDRLLTRLISGKLSVEDLDIQLPPSMTADS